jgi:hypothetical protein
MDSGVVILENIVVATYLSVLGKVSFYVYISVTYFFFLTKLLIKNSLVLKVCSFSSTYNIKKGFAKTPIKEDVAFLCKCVT